MNAEIAALRDLWVAWQFVETPKNREVLRETFGAMLDEVHLATKDAPAPRASGRGRDGNLRGGARGE